MSIDTGALIFHETAYPVGFVTEKLLFEIFLPPTPRKFEIDATVSAGSGQMRDLYRIATPVSVWRSVFNDQTQVAISSNLIPFMSENFK